VLNAYILNTQRLLQNPPAPATLYSTTDLTSYINTARGQLAGEAECIRRIATIQTVIGQRNYNFSSLTIGDAAVAGVIHVRRISYNVGQGARWFNPRPWEWFDLFYLNNPVPQNGPPKNWSQYGQGSAGTNATGGGTMSSGSFYIDPPPDIVYTLNCDCVCYPIALAQDADPEAIPYLWTDAVPFFAAYYALLSAQSPARQADASRMMERYAEFVKRARQSSNPSVNRTSYQQANDPTEIAKLGLQKAVGG
jgi:hypothetical protein